MESYVKRFSPWVLLPFLVVRPLAAQTPDSTRRDSVRTLEPIEVVGSIQPSAGPTVGSGVPARVTIIGEEAADAYEPRILSDVLSQQPGISLYDDLGSTQKVLIDLGCSSHNAMWEKNRLLMFMASLDWLTKGAVGDAKSGVIRMGY